MKSSHSVALVHEGWFHGFSRTIILCGDDRNDWTRNLFTYLGPQPYRACKQHRSVVRVNSVALTSFWFSDWMTEWLTIATYCPAAATDDGAWKSTPGAPAPACCRMVPACFTVPPVGSYIWKYKLHVTSFTSGESRISAIARRTGAAPFVDGFN